MAVRRAPQGCAVVRATDAAVPRLWRMHNHGMMCALKQSPHLPPPPPMRGRNRGHARDSLTDKMPALIRGGHTGATGTAAVRAPHRTSSPVAMQRAIMIRSR